MGQEARAAQTVKGRRGDFSPLHGRGCGRTGGRGSEAVAMAVCIAVVVVVAVAVVLAVEVAVALTLFRFL